jgi:hypothetical protein
MIKLISVALFAAVTGCSVVPKREAASPVESKELVRVYKKIVEYEDGLPEQALDPSKFTSDDPHGYYGYVLGYEIKNKDLRDRLYKRFHQLIPDISKADPETAARTKRLLDDLQRRFGISFDAVCTMTWDMTNPQQGEAIERYIKAHSTYHITRYARYHFGGILNHES